MLESLFSFWAYLVGYVMTVTGFSYTVSVVLLIAATVCTLFALYKTYKWLSSKFRS